MISSAFFLISTSIFSKDNKIAQPVGQVHFVVLENYKWGRRGEFICAWDFQPEFRYFVVGLNFQSF